MVYARPLSMDIEDIREACQQLPADTHHKPANFLAHMMYPLLSHSLKTEAAVDIAAVSPLCCPLGTTFTPSVADGASGVVDAKFNARNQKQKSCYLQPGCHHLSKYNGKLKTKYDRMLLGLHYANTLASHYRQMKDQFMDM